MNDSFKKLLFIVIGLLITSIGIKILSLGGQLTFGGTAGIGAILSYSTQFSWGFWFFVVNIPFFIISVQYLGKWFTISSLLSITAISLIRDALDYLYFPPIPMLAASILSGLFIGIGITFVLNNGSSLGGIHILAVFLDKKFNINRGVTIFVGDTLIVIASSIIVGWIPALVSTISIFIASNLVGRYKKSPIQETQEETESVSHSHSRSINM